MATKTKAKSKASAKKSIPTAIASASLTEQQQKWFASVREGLVRDTGKTLEQWAEIARKCPETKPGARVKWLKERYGLGVNRAAIVLDVAFAGDNMGWGSPEALIASLWKDPVQLKIHDALVAAAKKFDGAIVGEKKSFTGFSRNYQFAAARPTKDGVRLGLTVDPKSSKRLGPPKKNEGWSDRNKSVTVLTSTKDVDAELKKLLKAAFDAS
jgi:Domain of unknown function (DUF5655)/Domain of unknown function (DUF4287)